MKKLILFILFAGFISFANAQLQKTYPHAGQWKHQLTDTLDSTACQASFGYDTSNTLPNLIYFTDYSSGYINSWYWTFGDSTTSTLQNPTHTYAGDGTYYVCLTISDIDSNGNVICSGTYCAYIVIGNQPIACQANFGYYTDTTHGNMFSFYDYSSGNINSWLWTFGDSTTSTLQYPVHTYANTGTYTVCLTVSDIDSSGNVVCSNTYCTTVVAGNTPTSACQAYFGYYADTSHTNMIDFYDYSGWYSSGNINSWLWTFGDSTTSTLQNPVHIYAGNGSYYVCLTVSDIDSNGNVICSNTYCNYVYVNNTPPSGCQAYFGYYADTTHTNMIDFFNYSSGYSNSWYWTFGDSTSSTLQNPTHTYASNGTYYVCLTVSDIDSNGNVICSSTYCNYVVIGINTHCSAYFNIYPDSTTMHHYYVVNMASGIPPLTYMWSWGDGTYDTNPYPSHTYSAAGYYTICLTISDSIGCSSSYCDSSYIQKSQNSMITVNVISQGNPSGIKELTSDSQFSLFPNPATDNITVMISGKATIEMLNAEGQIMKSIVADNNETIIDVSSFAKGIYIVKVISEKGITVKKFIKQ
ncbi:MAG: PKD domain-containing protein [Bacteroidales bacterium]|jgi:PKD repeat protein